MAINLEEVKQFLTEDDGGKALIEELKAPVLEKNKALLSELKTARGREAEYALRADLAEKLVKDHASQREEEEAETKKEGLRRLAAKIAADEGVPIDPDKFIGPDEETTRSLVTAEASRFKQYAETLLKSRFGNTGKPRSGDSPAPSIMPRVAFEAMNADAKASFMRSGGQLTE